MGRYLLILVAIIWIAGTAAFFLYLPLLPVIAAGLVIFGLALMFVLGVHVGSVASIEIETYAKSEILASPRTNCAGERASSGSTH